MSSEESSTLTGFVSSPFEHDVAVRTAGRLRDSIERLKAQVRARGEHAFRVIKRQFGYLKVRYRGLTKNTAQLHTLFALANIWMVRRQLLATG